MSHRFVSPSSVSENMKQTGKCPKCGGTEIIADAKAIDRGDYNSQHEMSIATFRNPQAFIFKDKQEVTVSAWVCGSCGFIEYYADSPVRLKLPNLAAQITMTPQERFDKLGGLAPIDAISAWLDGDFGIGDEPALITAIRRDTRVSLSDEEIIDTICRAIDEGLDAAACLERLVRSR